MAPAYADDHAGACFSVALEVEIGEKKLQR
jgi:hypothetical protein